MNPMFPQPYGYGPYNAYNPMSSPQQRLAEMEQQYPQFSAQNMQNVQQNIQQPNFLKGRAVTSIDEAKAALIDLDGSLHVFTDIGNNCIYTKQINLDGTATLKTYKLDTSNMPKTSPETDETEKIDLSTYVQQKDLENVCQAFNMQIDNLEDRLKSYDIALQNLSEKQKGGTKK